MAFPIKTLKCVCFSYLFLTSCDWVRCFRRIPPMWNIQYQEVPLICPRNFNLEPLLTRTQGPIHETYTIARISPHIKKAFVLQRCALWNLLSSDVRDSDMTYEISLTFQLCSHTYFQNYTISTSRSRFCVNNTSISYYCNGYNDM